MSNKLNEFTLSLPVVPSETVGQEYGPAPEYADQAAVVMSPDSAQDSSVTIGTPATYSDPSSVTVYANSITPTSYNADASGMATFDVVFSVGINCGDGTCKTYQVVKRIGIDKARIAADVEHAAPVSIVENKKEEANKTALNETVSRARRLAGLE